MSDPTPPPGFVHVDLDGLWTIAEAYGFDSAGIFPADPIFERTLPRIVEFLERRGIRATFFIVGRDLEIESRRRTVLDLHRRGHELANHSYHHWIGLEQRARSEIDVEIARTQEALRGLTGVTPVGFRAPGYDAGPKVLSACAGHGLRYDGSLLPTRLAPLLRIAARMAVRGGGTSGPGARQYGGGSAEGRTGRPVVYRDHTRGSEVLRLPLPVSPALTWPLHASLGMLIGADRVRRGLDRAAGRGWPVTYLLHPVDFADPDELRDHMPPPMAASGTLLRPLTPKLDFLDRVLLHFQSITRPALSGAWILER